MTIDELNNALADMRKNMLAKGYPDPLISYSNRHYGKSEMDIVLFYQPDGEIEHAGAARGHKCPYEAVTAAYEIIDGLPELDPTEAIERNLAAAIDRARAAGVDVAAVIGGGE